MKMITPFISNAIEVNARKSFVRNKPNDDNLDLIFSIEAATYHVVFDQVWDQIWSQAGRILDVKQALGPSTEHIHWRMWEYDFTVEKAYKELKTHESFKNYDTFIPNIMA